MIERIVKSTVGDGASGCLLDYLSSRFTYHSPELWRELLLEGRVTLEGKAADGSENVAPGMAMEYHPREIPEPPVSFDVKLVFANEDFIVLDKPGNLPCHPAGCFFNNTLWAALKEGRVEGLPPMDDIHFVSRLDRETSGLLLVARNANAASRCSRMLASPDARRAYVVLVEGEFPTHLVADGWLFHSNAALVSKKRSFSYDKPADPGEGRVETAKTEFTLIRSQNGMSLLRAVLGTGRMHQIRATLCSLGYPVVGDKIYGRDETIFLRFLSNSMTDDDRRRLRMPRQALHASELHFGQFDFQSQANFLPVLED